MAQKSGERRLLFDTRGKRRHVIRVVYAILALLMGGSLFLVIGPVNIGELIGNSTSAGSAAEVLDERVERIERRVAKEPRNAQLLLTLTRAQISAGNAKVEVVSESEPAVVSAEARTSFLAASESWNRYLKQAGDEPNGAAAQLVAGALFQLAESGSTSIGEIDENVELAARAQRIAVEQQPSLGSLSTLAIYEYFGGNFAAGNKAKAQAAAKASSKAEAKNVEKQLAEYRIRAKQFQNRARQAAKQEQKAGVEALQNPFGGFGGTPGG